MILFRGCVKKGSSSELLQQPPSFSCFKIKKIKMGRKNSPSAKKKGTSHTNHKLRRSKKQKNRQLYLDADQLADIADWYASERKLKKHKK